MNEPKLNWECKECGHVCNRKGGIITHLARHHNIRSSDYEEMIKKTWKKPTNPKKLGVHKRIQESETHYNYKCKRCGHVCKSESGIKGHLINQHHITSSRENYEETSDAITNPIKGKWKRKKTKRINNKCPGGGKFGINTDELIECYDCPIWDECEDNTPSPDTNTNTPQNNNAIDNTINHIINTETSKDFPIEIKIISPTEIRIITPNRIKMRHVIDGKE